jgi:hypothetical protein
MKLALAIIGIFTLAVGLLIFVYEKPTKTRHKLTGRGGDFES